MGTLTGIPKEAAIAINDLLDYAEVKPSQEVLLVADVDGLYGGDNLVDQEAIAWIESAIRFRGANASVLWIDEPEKPHTWRFPPIVKGAFLSCNVFICHSFDIDVEDCLEFRDVKNARQEILQVRNFATTAPLLCTDWAQTPYELVSEIRYQAVIPFEGGLPFKLTDENGTDLEGTIEPSPDITTTVAAGKGMPYTSRREEFGNYRPWPEWVFPPIRIADTSGIFIFDRMHSWWSRYIGISPYLSKPIQLTIENCRITKIEGGDEADALRRFLTKMHERLGDAVYDFKGLHSGVHPHATVEPHQCPNILYRRLIEHCHSSNIEFHIGCGIPRDANTYRYAVHNTGDIRHATWRVGKTLIHDRGHLTALDHPSVLAVAAKYPGRPGPVETELGRYSF